ncbi:CaiB/BaiF CoA transferase family protein [Yinghuangia seranimata]|uniref:CaiB/BaiF CoA transferase family protein n=1 Tax=Yinghuangia seranimata TaxID=408067 RepID=UPI00248C6541|nr:CoA transferase [Yinghuangia seranimata]MDI2128495.1 CoA transferase [Yinghuangia seranimata]
MTWPHDAEAHDPRLPLAGVRVLDLSRILAGPLAATVLGDLGADVVKVESPQGDETRRWGPPFHGDDAAYFMALNRNRRALVLDLRDAEGQEAVRRLAADADVVVENFLPRQLASLGLDEVRDTSPHAVWVSIRGASEAGPLGDQPGYDAMAQARTGIMSVTGHPETGPTKVGLPVVDVVTGLYAAIGALAALLGRRHPSDGAAARVEVPLFECGVSALINQAANHLIGGTVPGLLGNLHPNVAPYGPIPTADGELVLGATSDRQFTALCTAIGRPELAADPRFADNPARVAHRDALVLLLADALRADPTRTWEERLLQAGIACAPVNTVDQVFAEEQVSAAALTPTVTHPAGPVRLVASPLRLDGQRPPIRRAPPLLGEHTAAILEALNTPSRPTTSRSPSDEPQ